MTIYPKLVMDALATVMYAGTKKNLVESGMVADTPVIAPFDSPEGEKGWRVKVVLEFPRDTDPFLKSTVKAAEAAIKYHCTKQTADSQEPTADIEVDIVTEFKNKARPADEALLPGVKHIIAVSSGKGGVGKSTVAVNLAVALARLGYRVGLLDTDIFGPSIPKMMGVEGERIYSLHKDGRDLILPIEKYGVMMLSIGFFVAPTTATLWRGGMACNALKQLIADADWGTLDYFILDTPPGTSDIHLSILQMLKLTGAIIVSTPQQVALADARKGIDMYMNEKVNVPILGLVENMAWFTPAELPQNRYYIFGREGCKQLAEEMHVPLLAQLPLVQSVCEAGDGGAPVVTNVDSMSGQAFLSLAQAVVTVVNRNEKKSE
ncbi:MAG: Mrp/NBP35 family ATP-binding protein [Prevotella sp.]|nr:Mrp/NBP35 family ATP-binding protein [Prevotella sp.]